MGELIPERVFAQYSRRRADRSPSPNAGSVNAAGGKETTMRRSRARFQSILPVAALWGALTRQERIGANDDFNRNQCPENSGNAQTRLSERKTSGCNQGKFDFFAIKEQKNRTEYFCQYLHAAIFRGNSALEIRKNLRVGSG